jgi:hypothetical protein
MANEWGLYSKCIANA